MELYGCDKRKLSSVQEVSRFLDELPAKIGMTKIIPPYVFEYHGVKPEDWGVSGVVLIAESHIAVHTYPDKGYVAFDAFSCKDFDTKRVAKMVVGVFGAQTYEEKTFERGKHFPKEAARNQQIMAMQRTQKSAYAPKRA